MVRGTTVCSARCSPTRTYRVTAASAGNRFCSGQTTIAITAAGRKPAANSVATEVLVTLP